jgi:hypothetical protein
MRLRRVQFDAYVLPDFSLEDFPLPEDLDFTDLGEFDAYK